MEDNETILKECLDEFIASKMYANARRALENVKGTFSEYEQYNKKLKEVE